MNDRSTITQPNIRPGNVRSTSGPGIAIDSDEILFNRYLQGDDSAFMELFHRHTTRLYAYCLKIVGDREKAHDIMQDVWERMARFRPEGRASPRNFAGFLIRSVRNRSLNQKARRRAELSLDDIPKELHPSSHTEGEAERREMVLVALDHLAEDQRELLILHAYSGYSYEEIAQILEESIGTVRTRAWRARVKLGRVIAALIDMADR